MNPFDLVSAVSMLRADLVWSSDFEAVREPLADLLEQIQYLDAVSLDSLSPAMRKLTERINNGVA